MFATLPVSRPRTERSLAQALASLSVHAGLIIGAVHVTQGAAAMVARRPLDSTAVYVQPIAQRTQPTTAAVSSAAVTPSAPTFAAIAPPTGIPTGIPPIDLGAAVVPSQFTGGGAAGGLDHDGVGVGDSGATSAGPRDFTQAEVDVPVRYLGGGEPSYPAALKQAGVEGAVTLQFVVSTKGAVEPASVRLIGSALPAFEGAAREAILRARFAPASRRGVAVRQLVQQRVVFEVKP
jgi:TonB family protein